MMSRDMRRTMAMLVAGCLVWMACGGSSSDGGATGSGGGSGSTASGTGGSRGSGGTAHSTVTSGTGSGTTVASGTARGTATTGTGGAAGNDAGRIACGTANTNTGCNPNGNNRVCDLPNNRCVQCTSDAECAANPNQMGNPHCDTVGMNMA